MKYLRIVTKVGKEEAITTVESVLGERGLENLFGKDDCDPIPFILGNQVVTFESQIDVDQIEQEMRSKNIETIDCFACLDYIANMSPEDLDRKKSFIKTQYVEIDTQCISSAIDQLLAGYHYENELSGYEVPGSLTECEYDYNWKDVLVTAVVHNCRGSDCYVNQTQWGEKILINLFNQLGFPQINRAQFGIECSDNINDICALQATDGETNIIFEKYEQDSHIRELLSKKEK